MMNLTTLLKIPLFHSLQEMELAALFAELNLSPTQIKRGEILALQGEPVNRLIILLSGSVKAEMNDEAGRMVKVEDIAAPNPLAILFLFGQENRFPVQVTAREEGTAIVIPKQAVLRMLCAHEVLLKNYLDISADFAARLSRKLHLISLRTIRQKVAVYLLDLSRRQGSDVVTLDRPKSALAEYFGVARGSLEREITRMEQVGILEASRRELIIKNRTQLVELITN